MWKLTIEDDQGSSTVVPLVRNEYTLGRTEDNTIRLTERNVSRKHAKLVKKDEHWFLVDESSYNGCFVNGVRLAEPVALAPRDLVQIADYRLELDTDETFDASALPGNARLSDTLTSSPQNLVAQCDRLVMVLGPTIGHEFLLGRTRQVLGRGEDSDICINHPSVSRRHAEIAPLGESRYELVDLNSANGLTINGVGLSRGLLDAHDLIELGDVVLKFIPAGEVYRRTAEEAAQLSELLGVEEDGSPVSFRLRLRNLFSTMSLTTRFAVGTLALLSLSLFVVAAVTNQKTPLPVRTGVSVSPERPSASAERASMVTPEPPTLSLLDRAQRLLENGEIEKAHELLGGIPPKAPETADARFALIEQKWADALFDQANQTESADTKRRLWDTIASTPTVDPERREIARNALSLLDRAPSDPQSFALDQKPAGTGRARAKLPTTTTATTAPTKKKTAAAGNPELGVSGTAKDALAAKQALRAKVQAGTATESDKRLLRVLCRQLGDASCSR